MMRVILAIFLGKFIFWLSRRFNIGGGSAAPGLYALMIEPNLIEKLSSQIDQNIMITGTNGKTTTARIIAHLVEGNGVKVLRNATGSNLERGLASTLLAHTDIWGRLKGVDLGIWEVDEAAFNKAVFKVKPQIIVFLNAFRDQLDRYGEVDTVIKNWRSSLEKISWDPLILINGGDLSIIHLTKIKNRRYEVFRVKNHYIAGEGLKRDGVNIQKIDYQLEAGRSKGLLGNEYKFCYFGGEIKGVFKTPGVYNLYNLTAALSVYYNLNLPIDKASELLADFEPAFGRFEKISLGESEGYVFLIKNPAGATQVFETVAEELKRDDLLLIMLNDNFADGRDISWIWDAEVERLKIKNLKIRIICSGQRAEDMAVRAKYAGFEADDITVIDDIQKALEGAKRGLKGRIFILPTYTALLELEQVLARQGVKKAYWREN